MQANAAWYITLIMCQFWHIWFCKTRRVSIFKHPGVYENRVTFYGVFIALAIMILCSYVPWLQDNVFYTANPPGQAAWVPHLFFSRSASSTRKAPSTSHATSPTRGLCAT